MNPISQELPEEPYTRNYVLGLDFNGFHRINYLEWGKEDAANKRTLLCVHGITRNARDFDYFAQKLCHDYRIICPDVVGRGDSDYLTTEEGYNYLQYNADMNTVLARLNVTEVDWIGTSMGGIMGMVLAALPQSPIRRLVVNDIGPEVPREALNSIAQYIGLNEDFENTKQAEEYFRTIYSEFAPMSDEDWEHLTKYSTRRSRTGRIRIKADPRIGDAFRDSIAYYNSDMWDVWERIPCPVLVLRGKNSTFLTQEIAEKMLAIGPKTTLVELDDVGHTPTLRDDDQVNIIKKWLYATK